MDVVLGLDVGGTKLLGGLVARDGEVVATRERATPRVDGRGDPGLSATRAVVADLLAEASSAGRQVRAVGIGVPEYVRDGRVTSAEVLAWDAQPADVLGDLPGLDGVPVVVEADVRCAALAEAKACGATDLAYLSWGTGLSWTHVVDGRCRAGARGEALALGEWPVDPRSGIGWPGSLEGFASGLAIQRRYEERTAQRLDGARIEARAADGDVAAAQVLEEAAEAVAWAVTALVQAVDPGLVVLGGGVGTGSRLLASRVVERVPQLVDRPGPPPVAVARAGRTAGLAGAALVALAACS